MQKWQFGLTWDQRWYWRRLHADGTWSGSARAFDTRMECVSDAFDHGYCRPQPAQHRVAQSEKHSNAFGSSK